MLEILEQKRQPLRGIRAHAKIDDAIVNRRINFDSISLWFKGDRLPGPSSTVLSNFTLRRPNVDYFMTRSLPLVFFNTAIDLGRFSLARDEIGIELQVG